MCSDVLAHCGGATNWSDSINIRASELTSQTDFQQRQITHDTSLSSKFLYIFFFARDRIDCQLNNSSFPTLLKHKRHKILGDSNLFPRKQECCTAHFERVRFGPRLPVQTAPLLHEFRSTVKHQQSFTMRWSSSGSRARGPPPGSAPAGSLQSVPNWRRKLENIQGQRICFLSFANNQTPVSQSCHANNPGTSSDVAWSQMYTALVLHSANIQFSGNSTTITKAKTHCHILCHAARPALQCKG